VTAALKLSDTMGFWTLLKIVSGTGTAKADKIFPFLLKQAFT